MERGRLLLTTQHGKERALRRSFRAGLGLEIAVCACDTDQLGSFSGEIARTETAVETCKRKALLGLAETGMKLGMASEASFGPHPAVPMLAVGHELLVVVDLEHHHTVVEHRLELRTNYSQLRLAANDDPSPWLQQVGFPSHGVIVRPASQALAAAPTEVLFKGIRTAPELEQAIAACRGADPDRAVLLESDMRAHMNPTRMASIRRLGIAMVRRLRCPCPCCGAPGWGLEETEPGLPCIWCGEPTTLTLQEIWGCSSCGTRRAQARGDGLQRADPGQCQWCNP